MTVDNLILERPGENCICTWMKRRVKRNQNVISLTSGPTGSGKSYVDLSLALEIDPEFNVSKQVVFSLSSLMKLINSDWFKAKKWKVVIFEEAQTSISNRNWQSAMNKMLNYVLSTFRHQNIILFFNAPFSDFLDSQSMKLVHMVIETRSIDRKKKVCIVRPKLQQYSVKQKKTYEHSLFLVGKERTTTKVMFVEVRKPPKEVSDVYEDMKEVFTHELNKNVQAEAEALEGKTKPKDNNSKYIIDTRRPMTVDQAEAFECYERLGKGLLVAKELGITGQAVSSRLSGARVKGYVPEFNGSKRVQDL